MKMKGRDCICSCGNWQRIVAALRKRFQSGQVLFTFVVALEFQGLVLSSEKGKSKE